MDKHLHLGFELNIPSIRGMICSISTGGGWTIRWFYDGKVNALWWKIILLFELRRRVAWYIFQGHQKKTGKKTSQNISKVFGWMPTLHTFQKNAQAWWFKVKISPRIELHQRSGCGYLENPAYGGGVTPQHTMCFLSFKTSNTSWCFRHHRAASIFFCFIVDPLCFLRPGWLVWDGHLSINRKDLHDLRNGYWESKGPTPPNATFPPGNSQPF